MKVLLILAFHGKPNVWQNSSYGVNSQNALEQSDCRIL